MPDNSLTGYSGYSFTSWPASPPVFEGISSVERLCIPAGTPDAPETIEPTTHDPVAAGASLLTPIEHAAAALAPAAGRVLGTRHAVSTGGQSLNCAEFRTTGDADPVWLASDDLTAIPRIDTGDVAPLIEWIDRFRAAGIWSHRVESPDLLAQLHYALRRPIDTILCTALDSDPGACLNAALAAWYGIDLVAGVALLARVTRAGRAMIAVDARLPPAWSSSLRRGGARTVEIVPLVPDYPQSDPTLLLYTLLNRRLRPARLPVEQGAIQLDATTAIALGRCALQGAAMLSVPVSVRDHVLRQSFFVFVPLGMRAGDLLSQLRVSPACGEWRGGDLLRDRLLPMDAVFSGGGELVLHASRPLPPIIPEPCVRCGWCVESCPTRVHPAGVLQSAQHQDQRLSMSFGLDACIECGICSYVCPSRLPLLGAVRYMRAAAKSGALSEPAPQP